MNCKDIRGSSYEKDPDCVAKCPGKIIVFYIFFQLFLLKILNWVFEL